MNLIPDETRNRLNGFPSEAGSNEHLVSAGRCSQASRIIGDCLSGFGKAGRVGVPGEAIPEGTDDWFDDVSRRAKAINLMDRRCSNK